MALRFSGTGSDVPEYTDRCLRLCLCKINHRRVQVSSTLRFGCQSVVIFPDSACGSAARYKASV